MRQFVILVGPEDRRQAAHDPCDAASALRSMQRLAARGLEVVAVTEVGGVRQEVTADQMAAIHGGDGSASAG